MTDRTVAPTFVFQIQYDDRARLRFRDLNEGPGRECGVVIDERSLTRSTGTVLDDRLADLIDIAVFVNIADRRAKRRGPTSDVEANWTRKIEVRVPLREPEFWQTPSIRQETERLLETISKRGRGCLGCYLERRN